MSSPPLWHTSLSSHGLTRPKENGGVLDWVYHGIMGQPCRRIRLFMCREFRSWAAKMGLAAYTAICCAPRHVKRSLTTDGCHPPSSLLVCDTQGRKTIGNMERHPRRYTAGRLSNKNDRISPASVQRHLSGTTPNCTPRTRPIKSAAIAKHAIGRGTHVLEVKAHDDALRGQLRARFHVTSVTAKDLPAIKQGPGQVES
jgi:hypothetical protein